MSKKIVVTGGSGSAATYVIRDLLEHGYQVKNLDQSEPAADLCPFEKTELTDYEGVRNAMDGYDAVISYASNPEPDFDFTAGAQRFANNTLCIYNAINAACELKMEKVVWASSETVLGFPFDDNHPASVPVHRLNLHPGRGARHVDARRYPQRARRQSHPLRMIPRRGRHHPVRPLLRRQQGHPVVGPAPLVGLDRPQILPLHPKIQIRPGQLHRLQRRGLARMIYPLPRKQDRLPQFPQH